VEVQVGRFGQAVDEFVCGQVKLFNFRAKLSNLWVYADAMPEHRPKQHVFKPRTTGLRF
jgi:hypothetical protein